MARRGRTKISTRAGRLEFLAYLKTVGEGPECITWPWATGIRYASTVDENGHQVMAHRWVYERVYGPLNGLVAAHTCDTPVCVRPSHLRGWTQGENLRDAYRKGRKHATRHAPPGAAHWNARLTDAEVYAIRRLVAQRTISHEAIARAFSMSRTTVTRIGLRTLWKHLPEEP